jgi:hypothetical protein|tara:strand:- start:1196 stop:1318 length:123 start_codon:yes stop_codon:yes gene_type:complete
MALTCAGLMREKQFSIVLNLSGVNLFQTILCMSSRRVLLI